MRFLACAQHRTQQESRGQIGIGIRCVSLGRLNAEAAQTDDEHVHLLERANHLGAVRALLKRAGKQ